MLALGLAPPRDAPGAISILSQFKYSGSSITSYVVLRGDASPSEELRKQLREHVGNEMGKIARPDEIWFVSDVPKTRSGKIMRRVIRSKALGKDAGDISTLANPEAVEEIVKAK